MNQKPPDRDRWCFDHSINAKSMMMARNYRQEIKSAMMNVRALSNGMSRVRDDVPRLMNRETYSSIKQDSLLRIICRSLKRNMCCMNGQGTTNYTCIEKEANVVLHPSSSIILHGDKPRFVCYYDMMRTSESFIRNVTILNETLLMELFPQKFVKNIMEKAQELVQVRIDKIGPEVIESIQAQQRSKILKLENSLEATIQINREKCELIGYCESHRESYVRNQLVQYVLKKKRKLLAKRMEYETSGRDVRLLMLPGGMPETLLFANEYIDVGFSGIVDGERYLHKKAWLDLVECYVNDITQVSDVWVGTRDACVINDCEISLMGSIRFKRPDAARRFIDNFNSNIQNQSLRIRMFPKRSIMSPNRSRTGNSTINMIWNVGKSKGFAFVNFQDHSAYLAALKMDRTMLNGRMMFCETPHRHNQGKRDGYAIRVSGLGSTVMEKHLRPLFSHFGRITSLSVVREHAYNPTPVNEGQIKRIMSEFGDVENVRIVKNLESRGSAWITFTEPEYAVNACEKLNQSVDVLCKDSVIGLELNRSYALTIPYGAYRLFKRETEIMRDECDDPGTNLKLSVRVRDDNFVNICVDGVDQRSVMDCRQRIDNLFSYERTSLMNNQCNKYLTKDPKGKAWLASLEGDFGVCVTILWKHAHIYGLARDRMVARYQMVKHLERFDSIESWCMDLPRGAVKVLVEEDGMGLHHIKENTGVDDLFINIRQQYLTAKGTPEALAELQAEVKLRLSKIPPQPIITAEHSGDASTVEEEEELECIICRSTLESNHFQLGVCGHRFCTGCVRHQLQSHIATNTFPISCVQCGDMFSLKDLEQLCKGQSEKLKLSNASVRYLLATRSNEFKQCPTPDCQQCYKASCRVFSCRLCMKIYCNICKSEYHAGQTCDEYKKSQQEQTDEMDKFRKTHDVRKCPSCGADIEKDGGCMHITCSMCQTHTCWICMTSYPTAALVYACVSEHEAAGHHVIEEDE
ncbi:hypothetical protein AKO1_005614 [Acrasis kona]|uniref:RBR-type E3 ubiquitin transferase n=1 Tax=Acrasis kona TaxID=1008807 RepID=A0AAW2YIW2_9EUKA